MPLFPSPEWMQEFCEALAAHPDVDQVASSLDGTYRFVVEPGGPLDDAHAYDVRIERGPPAEVALLEEPVDAPTLAIRASHERWRQLIEGTLDITMAVMLRRVRVQGDLGRIVGRLDRAGPLVEALGQVRTEWRDR